MEEKNKKESNPIIFGVLMAILIIPISWILVVIPAFAIQILGVEHSSMQYFAIMTFFQLPIGYIATKKSLESLLQSKYIEENKVKLAMITEIISISVLTVITAYLLPLVPFSRVPGFELFGIIAMIVIYAISHILLRKKYVE